MDVQKIARDIFGRSATGHLTGASKGRHSAHAGEHHDVCRNCDTPTPGNYCPECGQHAHVPRSIGHVLHELAHGVLHLDGKFWRTLPMLIFRPGKLTRDYIDGKRARYVAPFGIFLFTIFAFYFTFAFVSPADFDMSGNAVVAAGEDADPVRTGQQLSLADARLRRTELQTEIDAVAAEIEGGNPASVGALISARVVMERLLANLEESIAAAEARLEETGEPQTIDIEVDAAGMITDIGSAVEQERREGDFTFIGDESGEWDWLNDPVERMFEDPDYALYRIKQSAYKFSFLLLPLSIPFVWLMFFWRRDIRLYDHTIFILYSLSFISLLFIALWLALAGGLIGMASFVIVGTLLPLVHMFVQLKGAYRLGTFGALVRTVLLAAFANVVLLLFSLIVVGLGAFI